MTGYGQGQPPAFTWIGTASDTTLAGSSYGNNTFDLGAGGDTVNFANNGGNTVLFGAGGGQAQVNLNGGTGAVQIAGADDQNLWFLQNGNNLQIDLLGTNDSVTVNNWSGTAGNQVESAGDGMKIDSQLQQLVSAMATYSANNPGFNPTSSSNTQAPNDPNLQAAIAAAWHH
jgi:hypothetical protein